MTPFPHRCSAPLKTFLLTIGLSGSLLALSTAGASAPGCDSKLAWSSIAKEIAKVSDKASRKYSCPNPITVRCHGDGCTTRYHDGSAVPHTCNLRRLNLDISNQVTKTRAKLASKYGCEDSSTLSCAEGQSGWWSCAESSRTLLQKSANTATSTGKRGCNEKLLLDELSKEIHDELTKSCPFVKSVTCDDAATHQCSFGVDMGETQTCPRVVKRKITKEVHEELQEAKTKYGCNIHHTLVCTYDKPNAWPECTFADLASQPSGEEHGSEL